QPNETRLVSYAVDLGTEVAPETKDSRLDVVTVKISKGILQRTDKYRQTRLYTVKNRSDHSRLVLIEHLYRPDWQLVKPEKVAERTREVYRFELKVGAGETLKQEVVEEHSQ